MENAIQSVSLREHKHISEMHENLRRKLQESQTKDRSRLGAVRFAALNAVVSEDYERAKSEIREYVASKPQFPDFQNRAERLVNHACDLIQAIDTKRSFPGLASLSLAKQQEIHEKVLEHFEELKDNLRQIEKLEREHRLDDLRSTVWVVRSFWQMLTAVLLVGFMLDLGGGLGLTLYHMLDVTLTDVSNWVVNLVNL